MPLNYDSDIEIKGWHFKKTIDVGVLVFLALQTAAAIWYASQLYAKVDSLETRVSKNEIEITTIKTNASNQNGILNRLDERTLGIQQDLKDIKKEISSQP